MEDDGTGITICIEGQKCLLLDSDLAAPMEEVLLLWGDNEEEDLWIDKYDVRMLCGNDSIFFAKKGSATDQEKEEEVDDDFDHEELLYERYQGLLDVKECELPAPFTGNGDSDNNNNSNDGNNDNCIKSDAVSPFSYTQYYDEMTEANLTDPFIKPNHTFPSHIRHFPDTMKQYNIILHTAHAVRRNPQLEILLKVKQKGNPTFYFLEEDINSRCDLYQLYSYLRRDLDDEAFWGLFLGKDKNCSKEMERESCVDEEELSNVESLSVAGSGNALALLGAYSESDDDNDDDDDDDDDGGGGIENVDNCDHAHENKKDAASSVFIDDGVRGSVSVDSEAFHDGMSVDSFASTMSLEEVEDNVGGKDEEENGELFSCGTDDTEGFADDPKCTSSGHTGGVKVGVDDVNDGRITDDNGDCRESEIEMLDSDVDEQAERFWTRCSRLQKERKIMKLSLAVVESERVCVLKDQEELERQEKLKGERLRRAKMLSGHFLLAAAIPNVLPHSADLSAGGNNNVTSAFSIDERSKVVMQEEKESGTFCLSDDEKRICRSHSRDSKQGETINYDRHSRRRSRDHIEKVECKHRERADKERDKNRDKNRDKDRERELLGYTDRKEEKDSRRDRRDRDRKRSRHRDSYRDRDRSPSSLSSSSLSSSSSPSVSRRKRRKRKEESRRRRSSICRSGSRSPSTYGDRHRDGDRDRDRDRHRDRDRDRHRHRHRDGDRDRDRDNRRNIAGDGKERSKERNNGKDRYEGNTVEESTGDNGNTVNTGPSDMMGISLDREAIRSKLVKIMSHSHRGGSRNDMADGPSPEEEGLLDRSAVRNRLKSLLPL